MQNKITKNPTGRPSKYHEGAIQIAKEYIDSCGRESTELPTIEGLALKLDVDDTTVLKWGSEHEGFLATIKELKFKQKNQLINDGLYGGKEVNAGMAIFLLKANHGMIETERRELVGKDGEPLNISFILGHEYIPTIRQIDGTSEGSAGNRALQNGGEVQDASLA